MKKPARPSQVKLKKEIINMLSNKDIHVESIELVNEDAQVPNQLMVEMALTGKSTLTIQFISKKTAARYKKRMGNCM